MEIIFKIDKWDKDKIWIIKHYNDGHYSLNQKIKEVIIYPKYLRVTKKYLKILFTEI